jgi:hypothetical protein
VKTIRDGQYLLAGTRNGRGDLSRSGPFHCTASARQHSELEYGIALTPRWHSRHFAAMKASLRVPLHRSPGRVPGIVYGVVNHAARVLVGGMLVRRQTGLLAACGQQALPVYHTPARRQGRYPKYCLKSTCTGVFQTTYRTAGPVRGSGEGEVRVERKLT